MTRHRLGHLPGFASNVQVEPSFVVKSRRLYGLHVRVAVVQVFPILFNKDASVYLASTADARDRR